MIKSTKSHVHQRHRTRAAAGKVVYLHTSIGIPFGYRRQNTTLTHSPKLLCALHADQSSILLHKTKWQRWDARNKFRITTTYAETISESKKQRKKNTNKNKRRVCESTPHDFMRVYVSLAVDSSQLIIAFFSYVTEFGQYHSIGQSMVFHSSIHSFDYYYFKLCIILIFVELPTRSRFDDNENEKEPNARKYCSHLCRCTDRYEDLSPILVH